MQSVVQVNCKAKQETNIVRMGDLIYNHSASQSATRGLGRLGSSTKWYTQDHKEQDREHGGRRIKKDIIHFFTSLHSQCAAFLG